MKSSNRCRCVLAFILVFSGLSLGGVKPGRAADEDPEMLIRQGVALRKRGEDAKSLGYFQRAYDIAHTPRTAAQLGLVLLALGRYLDAEVRLEQSLVATDPWIAAHYAALETARNNARAQLGKIEIQGAPADATVETTGRPAMKLPPDNSIWVSPGSARLRVEAQGFEAVTREVSVALGGKAQVRITMARLAPEHPAGEKVAVAQPTKEVERKAPQKARPGQALSKNDAPAAGPEGSVSAGSGAPTAEEHTSRRSLRVASMVVGGAGVAAAVAGVFFYLAAGRKVADINSTGNAGNPYNPADGNYTTYDRLGVGMMIGGGVALAAGVVGLVLGREPQPVERKTVMLGPGPGELGLAIGARY